MEEKDNLSEYFKKQLEDYSPDPSWNVPDDHLFESALTEIPREPSYKKLFPLLLFLILASGLAFLGITTLNYYDHLSNNIAALQDKVDQLQEDNQLLISQLSQNKTTIRSLQDENDKLLSLNKIQNTISESKSFGESNYSSTKNDLSNQNMIYQKEDSGKSVGTERTNQDLHTEFADHVIQSKRVSYQTPKINAQKLEINFINEKFELNKTINADIEGTLLKSPWRINIGLINNFSWLTMKDVPAKSESALTEYDKAHGCYGIKIGAEYLVNNKWSVYADLSFNRFQNRSNLQTDFFYDKSMENGNRVEMDLDIINPFGSYYSPASFRVDSEIEHNDIIQEKASIRQHLTTLSMNTGLNYQLINTEKVSLSIGSGIGISNTVKLKNEFDISVLHKDELKVSYLDETNKIKGVKSYFLQGEVRSTFAYHLTNRSSLYIEGSYQNSLTSLRDSWPATGPKTYLHAMNIGTGFKFNF